MSNGYQIVVCAGIVPDPLQALEPVLVSGLPALKNEMMLPAVLDTWAAHSLYEAAHLAAEKPGSKVWLASIAPKAKLQQVMMSIAQKAQFELLAIDCQANGFTDSYECAALLAEMIKSIPNLDRERLFIFGGWESASRGAGVTLQIVGELLGIRNQFQGVDEIKINEDGSFDVYERISEGKHQISRCSKPPAIIGWATGNLPEPKNNPQIGMMNMRTIMPSLQKAKPMKLENKNLIFDSVQLPKQERQTRIVKDSEVEEIAREIVEWIRQ
jgi:electron transfer flavoprotein beta subunit